MPKINGLFFSTDREIQNLKPQDKRYSVKDKLNNGLFIEVKESGVKSWHYRYSLAGKQERLVIGRYPDLSLKDARQIRDESASLVAKGDFPKPLQLSERRVAWIESDIDKWIAERIASHKAAIATMEA